jgi:hemerythrin-like metal-binding protein
MEFSIEWNDSYLIGVDEIDNQHKSIVKLANSISPKSTKLEIASSVMELYKYTRTHFHDEELIMEQNNYPDLNVHKEMHNKLIEKLNEISPTMLHGDDAIEIFKILTVRWIVQHIMVHDKKFITFYRNKTPANNQ